MLKITKNQGSIQVTADNSGFYPFDGTLTFPTNSLFTATSANTDMVTFKSTSNGDVQFVGNYKDITISGRSYDTKQKFLTAFSNLANQGSVDAYTKAETDAKIDAKQGKLKAGNGITLTEDATDNTTVVKTKLSMDRGPFNDDGIKIGRAAQLNTSNGIAVGDESLSEYGGIAIGYKAKSHGISSIVIGMDSSDQDGANVGTSVGSGVVIGDNARGAGAGVVIGGGAHGGSAGAVIGYNSTVDGNGYGYAIGDNVHISETTNMVPIAIGYGAEANETKPLAITILKVTDTDSDGNPEMKYCDFIQGDANGKLSILKGDGSDERIVIQDALSAGGSGGGTVDAYTKAETDTKLDAKQDKLTAGSGITITKDETAGTSTIATAVSLTDNGNGAYQVGNSIKMGDGIAIGPSATSPSARSIAIGNNAKNTDQECIAIGSEASTNSGGSNVAVGYKSTSSGGTSIAIGGTATASNYSSTAIGDSATATGVYSLAIGSTATASGTSVVAIGDSARASDATPLAIKAVNKSMILGDANGKISLLKGDGTDERIVIQDEIAALKNAGGSGGSGGSIGGLVINTDKVTAGLEQTFGNNNPTGLIAIGNKAKSYSSQSVVIGQEAYADGGNGSTAIGYEAKCMDEMAIAVGHNSYAGTRSSIAIGKSSSTRNSTGNISIGYMTESNTAYSISIGYQAKSEALNGVSIGKGAESKIATPLVINAGYKTVDGNVQPLTVLQSDKTGKLSILKGDGTDERIVIQDALSAGGSGGSANPLVNVKGTDSATITDTVTDAVAIGSGAKVTEELSVAIGAANALSGHCVAIGSGANATKMSSVAIGDGAMAQAHMFDVAIGFHAATTDTKPLEINAGYKTVGGATTPLTVLQSDKTGKLSILKGDNSDERIVISDEITALKAEITTLKAEIAALKGGASTGA